MARPKVSCYFMTQLLISGQVLVTRQIFRKITQVHVMAIQLS